MESANDIGSIEYDYIEQCYIDEDGNTYKTIEDIPEDMRYLIKPLPLMKALNARRRSEYYFGKAQRRYSCDMCPTP